jgi:hypothetical protein
LSSWLVCCKFKERLDILRCIAKSPICHGWQNGQHVKNENLVSCFLAIGQANHYMQMDLQESSRNKWRSRTIQSHVSDKVMWIENKSLLWRNNCIGCKMEHRQNNECFSMIKRLEGTSFGCDNGILKWTFSWWSLHLIVVRIWLLGSEHLVCRPFWALHGLKQTPFNGFKKLIVFWRKINYKIRHLMATCITFMKMKRWWY